MSREDQCKGLSPRDLKLRWKYFREDALRDWLERATEDEQEAAVDLLVALELGQRRNYESRRHGLFLRPVPI